MIEASVNVKDKMTPMERKKAIQSGADYDRIPIVPFIDQWKCRRYHVTMSRIYLDPFSMAEMEIESFNEYGHDRMRIGPNSMGIAEALGANIAYPPDNIAYIKGPVISDAADLDRIEAINARKSSTIERFRTAAAELRDAAKIVPLEASIGGPLTIASFLRDIEILLRDMRRAPQMVHRLMRIVTDSQKSCIDAFSEFGIGIAMADPVANPELIGAKRYGEFVFPYTKEITEYALEKSGHPVSLHMCGRTQHIWKFFKEYPLGEISLDNAVSLAEARAELEDYMTIAGNVDPTNVITLGTKEMIFDAVRKNCEEMRGAKNGYVLATGCDVPHTAEAEKVEWFMEAGRKWGAFIDM